MLLGPSCSPDLQSEPADTESHVDQCGITPLRITMLGYFVCYVLLGKNCKQQEKKHTEYMNY